ncbi:hypothetical protein D3C85_13510 [compost metagenome]
MNKQQYLAQATPDLTPANAAIIEVVKASNFVLKDEHDNTGERELHLAGVAVYQNGDRQDVVALFSKDFSSYYCLNRIAVRDGKPAVTRDNCGGIVSEATNDPVADVKAIIDNIAWDSVEKYPCLTPGQYFNIVLKSA